MSTQLDLRVSTIEAWVKKEIKRKKVCEILGCSVPSAKRYKSRYIKEGIAGLKDRRSSNNFKLTVKQKNDLEELKKT